jgi:hypothetical protein
MTFFVGYIDTAEYLLSILDALILGSGDFWTKVFASIFAILSQNSEKILKMTDISDVAMFFQGMSQN